MLTGLSPPVCGGASALNAHLVEVPPIRHNKQPQEQVFQTHLGPTLARACSFSKPEITWATILLGFSPLQYTFAYKLFFKGS